MNIDITIQTIANGHLVHVSGLDKPFCYHTMASVQQALPNLIQMAANAEMLAKFKTRRKSTVKHPHPMPEPLIDGHGRPYWNADIARGPLRHGDGEQRNPGNVHGRPHWGFENITDGVNWSPRKNPGEHADGVERKSSDFFGVISPIWPTPDRHEDGKDIKGPEGDAINEALRVKMADAQKQKPTYADLREKLWAMAKAPTQLYSEQRDYCDETTAD